jgi:hypothetical protein
MTKRVWHEMIDIKYGEIYLSKYLGLQRTLKRIFKILTLILSLSGILGWKYFEDYVWIALILISVIQIFTLVENQLIRSDKEIEDISALRQLYSKYYQKLEKLWTQIEFETLTEKNSMEKYFELRDSDWLKIEDLDSQLNVKKYKKLMKQTEIETNSYINKYLYHEQEK